jgi:SSS family solute:Na+ symporter
MAGYTCDQVMVQRFQTTKSLKDSRQAFVVNAAGDALWMFGLSFVGLALLAYFNHHPLPAEFSSDKIVPYFMSVAFPTGAVGLVIAAILAASLSSIDSAINSCTSVVVVDFYNRLGLGRQTGHAAGGDERRQVLVSRVATVLFGLTGTLLATNVSRIGTLLEIANKLINAFSGPLFGIYLFAMFSRSATSGPVLIAGITGTLTSYWVAYQTSIGFMWPSTFGLAATLVVGGALSVMSGTRASAEAQKLTWWEVTRRGEPTRDWRPHR